MPHTSKELLSSHRDKVPTSTIAKDWDIRHFIFGILIIGLASAVPDSFHNSAGVLCTAFLLNYTLLFRKGV